MDFKTGVIVFGSIIGVGIFIYKYAKPLKEWWKNLRK